MDRDRIDSLYDLLGCNSTDIARTLGCSPSAISRVRAGSREYTPTSRPVLRFAEGIYRCAEQSETLSALRRLCSASGENREALIPSLVSWLFCGKGVSSIHLIPAIGMADKRGIRGQAERFTGEKLSEIMDLLELSNLRLAQRLNVDASTVSRFRNGLRIPKPPVPDVLVEVLLQRAEQLGRVRELSMLCGVPDNQLNAAALAAWLYGNGYLTDGPGVDSLIESIEQFPERQGMSLPEPAAFLTSEILDSTANLYWGVDGLRTAVLRFLGTAAHEGGTLWLYSGQSMDWMVGDPAFRAKWAALMTACVRSGVRIRIIHNIDRGVYEMQAAIESWLPLYMSGMIEAYVCRMQPDARFVRTIFLRPGVSCITGSVLRGLESAGRYEYLTDQPSLDSIAAEYDALLASSVPLLRIQFDSAASLFEADRQGGKLQLLSSSLTLGTMPESVLLSILSRSTVEADDREKLLDVRAARQARMDSLLAAETVIEYLALPADEELFTGTVQLESAQFFCDTQLFYTPEEFDAHIRAVIERLERQERYEVILLPDPPFRQLQIEMSGERASVIRMGKPYAAFVFSEPSMVRSFGAYFSQLRTRYQLDRKSTIQLLRRFL